MTADTPEERVAAERLDAAVRDALEAYGMAVGVVTDLVVIYAQQYFADDGVPHTQVGYLSPSQPPHYRLMGLVDYAQTRLRAEVAEADAIEE